MVNLLFYLFASVCVFSGFMVIFSKNPVHSVLFLVLAFCNGSGLLLLIEAEFMAFLFLVVYVGAIAVLFLFVVMMLTPRVEDGSVGFFGKNFLHYLPTVFLLVVAFLGEIYILASGGYQSLDIAGSLETVKYSSWFQIIDGVGFSNSNLEVLGQVLYTYYLYYFLLAGFILLVSMVGAVVLTLQRNIAMSSIPMKNQKVFEQLSRRSTCAVFSVKLK